MVGADERDLLPGLPARLRGRQAGRAVLPPRARRRRLELHQVRLLGQPAQRACSPATSSLFDLKRMESAYYAQNARELEITRHVSLLPVRPVRAGRAARHAARATSTLPELLFDLENPGHYMRRLKTVAITVPVRRRPVRRGVPDADAARQPRTTTDTSPATRAAGDDLRFATTRRREPIVTSGGQNDSGLFEVSLDDERYLPFEGSGVVGTWQLRLNTVYPQFDYSTITDVVLHLRYTARDGGGDLRAAASGRGEGEAQPGRARREPQGPLPAGQRPARARPSWARFLNPGAGQRPGADDRPRRRAVPVLHQRHGRQGGGIDVIAKIAEAGDTPCPHPPRGRGEAVTIDHRSDPRGHASHRRPAQPGGRPRPRADSGHRAVPPTWTLKLNEQAGRATTAR